MDNIKKQSEYDKMLESLIPNLHKYSFLSGCEGKVYFIDKNFVVKEYYPNVKTFKYFNDYCEEIKSFSEKGFDFPKIYAWTIQNNKYSLMPPTCYILEERAKGKPLFLDLVDLQEKYKDKLTEREFFMAIANYNKKSQIYSQIVIDYYEAFLERLQQILDLPETKIQNLLESLLEIYMTSIYSFPDIHRDNVLFDGESFKILDLSLLSYPNVNSLDIEVSKEFLIDDIFKFFDRLFYLESIHATHIDLKPRASKIKKKVYDTGLKAVKKFIKNGEVLVRKKLNTDVVWDRSDIFDSCMGVIGKDFAEKLIKELEKE